MSGLNGIGLVNGAREVARMTNADAGRAWVLAETASINATPWVTWEVDADGNCYSGHYFGRRDTAVLDLLNRAVL